MKRNGRRWWRWVGIVSFVFHLACGSEGGEQEATVLVDGRLLDTAGTPIEGAGVVFRSDPVETASASGGVFQARVMSGKHRLEVTALGRKIIDREIIVPVAESFALGDLYPDEAFFARRVTVRQHGQTDSHYDYQQWCAVTVADSQGRPVIGLGYDDFEIVESAVRIDDGQIVAEESIPLEEQSLQSAYDLGLFERSVTGEKLDLVFLTDHTSSFNDDGTDVRGQIKSFVEKLVTARVDFRVAGVAIDQTPDDPDFYEFYGPEQIDLLLEEIDIVHDTAGDWWGPTCAYEALLFTPYLGYRPDARRVAVILTDIVPHTVYGTDWYSIDAGMATRSAAERFLEDNDIELFYAIFEHPAPDIEFYWQPHINPRAGETGSEKYGVPGSGLSELTWGNGKKPVQLAWPFSADELWEKLGLKQEPLADSIYMMTWRPVIDRDDLDGGMEKYNYRVSVRVKDPENAAQKLAAEYEKPATHPTATAEIQLLDEEGNPFVDTQSYLYVQRVDRPLLLKSQVGPDGAGKLIFKDLVPQKYFLEVVDSSYTVHGFSSLRAIGRLSFDLPPEGARLQFTVQTAEHHADEALLQGLLRDLDAWRLSGDPYRKFAKAVNDWLYDCSGRAGTGILCNGLNWAEQAALRHLILVLAGYANLNEYAQMEAQRAIEDFEDIIRQVGELVKEIKKLQRSSRLSWQEALAAVALRALLDVATGGGAEAVISGIEALLKELVDYLSDYVYRELVELMKDKIMAAAGIGRDHPVALMLDVGLQLYDNWSFSDDGGGNLDLLWQAVERLGLQLLVEKTAAYANGVLVRQVFENLSLDDQLQLSLKIALQGVVQEAWRGALFENFQQRLEAWANYTGTLLATNGREQILSAIDGIFEKGRAEIEKRGMPENFCDFVLGFLQDMARLTVPELKNGRLVSGLKIERVTSALIKHAVYGIFLRDRFVEDFQAALWESFFRAQAVAATPSAEFDRWQWRSLTYNNLFRNFRSAIDTAQDVAWDALEKQKEIHNWAEGLQALQGILVPLGELLDIVSAVYTPLEDAADAVHAFTALLDGIQVVAKAIEFGIKLRGLDQFGALARTLYVQAFE